MGEMQEHVLVCHNKSINYCVIVPFFRGSSGGSPDQPALVPGWALGFSAWGISEVVAWCPSSPPFTQAVSSQFEERGQ